MELRRFTPHPLLSLALLGAACIPLKGDLGDFTATADDTDGESSTSAGLTSGTSSTSTTGPDATSSTSTGPAQTGTSSTSTTGPDTSGTSSTSTTDTSGTSSTSTTGPDMTGTSSTSTGPGTSSTGPDTSGTSSTSTTGGWSDPYPMCGPGVDDPYTIGGAKIVGDTLHLDVTYSGGCEPHDFSLCFGGIVLDLGWVNLDAVHDAHGDLCKALISEPRTFDLTPLKVFQSPVTIVLEGWPQQLKYVH